MKNLTLTLMLITAFTTSLLGQNLPVPIHIKTFGLNIGQQALEYNGKLFFTVQDALWESDGTQNGTQKVFDLRILEMKVFNGKLYFVATDGTGNDLWESDGTTMGTKKVKDISAVAGRGIIASYIDFTVVNTSNQMFFYADDGVHGIELWKSDGTASGTQMIKDINPTGDILDTVLGKLPEASIGVMNNKVFFSANDGNTGPELWTTDGTATGTHLVKDIFAGMSGNNTGPERFMIFNGNLVFCANDVNTVHMYKTDGTDQGTVSIGDTMYSTMSDYAIVGNKLFFVGGKGQTTGLMVTDGNPGSTQLLKELSFSKHVAGNRGNSGCLVVYNGKVYFPASVTLPNEYELWVSDGTSGGTTEFKDVTPAGNFGSDPSQLTLFGGYLYFRARDAGYVSQLWRTDGTDAGTQHIQYPGADIPSFAGPVVGATLGRIFLTPMGNRLFFGNHWNYHENHSLYMLNMFADKIDHVAAERFNFYPNPAKERIFLDYAGEGRIAIHSLSGHEIATQMENNSVHIEHLTPGIYILTFTWNEKVIQKTFVKE